VQLVSLIAALDNQGGIGLDGKIPWHLPADLAHFKQITMGHPVVMGRKTFQSIARPLPGRRNIVITRQTQFSAPGCEVAFSLIDALKLAGDGEAFVIGGAAVYREALPQAVKLYLTRVNSAFAADTFFPSFDEIEWQVRERVERPQDEKNPWSCEFIIYERISSGTPARGFRHRTAG
jgi:dihydrofolate reductase